jgi:hypothetical protein
MLSQDIDFLKNDNKGDEVTNPATPIVVKLGNTSSNKEFGDSHSESTPEDGFLGTSEGHPYFLCVFSKTI